MATYQKFNAYNRDLLNGVHNWSVHTFKALLTNTAPVATNAVKADLTEISAGNGYTAGGATITVTSVALAGATATPMVNDVTITASGGSIGPFRYIVVYNDTPTSPADPLVAFFDYGSSVSITDGNNLLIDFNAAGLFDQA